ncbi:hypothetical protein L1049_021846 [Liquidambar formosana]|uniref:Uncharacterized protein n=1 Tax=Liquidambar formosana TaxID=63359 RepID=A0AAP0WN36_LIQFO
MLSVPNFGNLMNPWDNALRLQADANQLAKIQLMQNLLHVRSTTSSLPNMTESNPSYFEGLPNGTSTFYGNPNIAPPEFPNPGVTPYDQPLSDYQPISNLEGGFSSEVHNINNDSLSSSYEIQTEQPLPVSVSVSPNAVNQMESTINPTCISTQSPTSSIFETWREFMDDEACCSDWKDNIE